MIWGSYPVFAKRAVLEVPKFSLVFFASMVAMLVGVMLIWRRDRMTWGETWDVLRSTRALWLLAIFVVIRSVTNIISIELTKAVWVQMINILAPFPVAFIGVLFFAQATPPYTYRALLLSTIGAAMMLVQDWSHALAGFAFRDVLGLTMAVVSTLSLSVYLQLVTRSQMRRASGGLIMVQQGAAMAITFLALSFLTGEQWEAWRTVSVGGWLAVMAVIWLVQVGGNVVQITALGGANPALITSMMALRLVSALALGWLILGEFLVSPTQWLGAVLVVGTVTTYLWLQKNGGKSARQTE